MLSSNMASSKSNGLEPSDWARAPVNEGPTWQRLLKVIYNPEEKSFLGRTAKRWGIVLVFYAVFYAVLALMFSLCMGGLFLTIDDKRPTHILDKSLIGANPGVAFRPRPKDGVVVRLDRANSSHTLAYTEQLDEFFKPYDVENKPGCSANDSYGYPDAPCFYIKLNKIYGWEPDYYDAKGPLPSDMPQDLVEFIQAVDHSAKHKQIWISCAEEKQNNTVIEYPWGRGLDSSYYPFLSQPGYLSPVVAVRLLVPVNTPTTIRCRAWAKNIIYNKSVKDPSGYTQIQLLIEDKETDEKVESKQTDT